MKWNDRIKEARQEAGISNAELARAIGVKPASITLWENYSTKNLDAANCIKACEVLGIRPQWLMFGRGPKRAADSKLMQSVIATLEGLPEADLRRAEVLLRTFFEGMHSATQEREPLSPHAIEQKYSPGLDATGVQDGTGSQTGPQNGKTGRGSR